MKLLKVTVIFISIFALCSGITAAQTLRLVAELNVEEMNFEYAKQIKVMLAKGKSLGQYLSIPLLDEIDAILNKHAIDPKTANVIVAGVSNTETKYYTYHDFDKDIAMLPPYLISQEKVSSKLYDTVHYYSRGGTNSADMDMKGLNRQVFGTTVINIRLQFNSINAALKQKMFSSFALLFPVDNSPKRWLSDIKSIKVFVIE